MKTSRFPAVAFDLDGTLYPDSSLNIRLVPFLMKESKHMKAFGKARVRVREEARISEEAANRETPAFGTNAQAANPGASALDKNAQAANLDELSSSFIYKQQARFMSEILGIDPKLLEEKNERAIYRGWEPLFKKVRLFSHVKETLRSLRENGVKLGLLSDFPPKTKLENLGLGGLWDVILCSEEIGRLKPHPLPFQKLAQAMGFPAEKIIYVGNSFPYDVQGAKKTGMKTAWIRTGISGLFPDKRDKQADFVFNDYRQLLNFVLI